MASISVRSGPPGSPTHPAQSLSRRRNGLHDMDLNTFIAEEMALHLDSAATRKRGSAPHSDVITDSPTHKRNRMLWTEHWILSCPLLGGPLNRRWGLMPCPTLKLFLFSCNVKRKLEYYQSVYLSPLFFHPISFFVKKKKKVFSPLWSSYFYIICLPSVFRIKHTLLFILLNCRTLHLDITYCALVCFESN